MKFLAKTEMFTFAIWFDVLIFLYLLIATILWHAMLAVLAFVWIFVAIRIVKLNYVLYSIEEDKFVVTYMKQSHEIYFAEIAEITEMEFINKLGRKEYKITLSDRTINEKLLEIQNRVFERWINEHRDLFQIKTQVVL